MDTIRQLVSNPLFDQVQDLLKERDTRLIKELLLLARHMGLANGVGNFRDLTQYATDRLMDLPRFRAKHQSTNRDAYLYTDPRLQLEEFFNNPLYAGAIIMSCFLAPLSDIQEEQMRFESMMKEINIMDSDAFFDDLDFSPFFGHFDNQLHPSVPANPKQAKTVFEAISRWIGSMENTILYPTMSKKLLPSFTRREMEDYIAILMEDPSTSTPGSIEYLDVVEGISVTGASEMSQRWYTNQIKPRSYFVSGATAHHKSKFLKEFWNKLVDELSVTNRFNRINPRRLHYDGVKQGVFYDLTSFTSNMSVQRKFLDILGLYCIGHRVTVMDGRKGSTDVDMGELILEYNQLNWFPEYTSKLFDNNLLRRSHHGVGGFLGVFGNIATCTFLHGSFLLQLVTHEDECSCAGDDAIAFVEDESTIWGCVPLIGILAPEKTYLLSDHDVVYLKRRTWMDFRDFRLRQKSYIQFPSMLTFETSRNLSRFRESSMSRRELVKIAANSLSATFRSMARVFSEQGAFQEGVRVLTQYYDLMRFPHEGNVPQFSPYKASFSDDLIPSLDTLGSHDFISLTIQSLYPGRVMLPRREKPGDMHIILKGGTRFHSQSSRYVTYLKRLGYLVEVDAPKDEFTGDEGLLRILAEFDRDVFKEDKVVVYQVVRDVPSFIFGGEATVVGSYSFDFSYMRYDAHNDTAFGSSGDIEDSLRVDDDSDVDFDDIIDM